MKIAVFHYFITNNNPAGKCVKTLVEGLAKDNEIVVFASDFENNNFPMIRWVKVPSIHRPLFLLYLTFLFVAPIFYLKERLRRKFDTIIYTESRIPFNGIAYVHFCHRAYLKYKWKENSTKGIRRLLKYFNHALHSFGERLLYPRLPMIVVPSIGLKKEIQREYAACNIVVIPNPVDNKTMERPQEFDVSQFRNDHQLNADDLVMVFVALGDFERKGLDLIFNAMSLIDDSRLKLMVVGGNKGIISSYSRLAVGMGIDDKVVFVGMQNDVRPYLWGCDVFVFPTLYEIFPLVVLEAAAAGLTIIVTKVYGVEEYINDRVNGYIVERNVASVKTAVKEVLEMDADKRALVSRQAQEDVRQYSSDAFVRKWKKTLGCN